MKRKKDNKKNIKFKYYQIQKHFSAPFYFYLVILLVSICMILLQVWWDNKITRNALANIGYSLMASWLAAILVDYGNNKILNQRKLREFNQLTFNHNQLAFDFYIIVSGIYEEKYGSGKDDIAFGEMIDNMLDPYCENYNVSEQEHEKCISEVLHILNQFYSESKKLKKTLEEHIENPYSTGRFRSQLELIAYETNEAVEAINQKNYDWAAETIIYNLIPIIAEIYPETQDYYVC